MGSLRRASAAVFVPSHAPEHLGAPKHLGAAPSVFGELTCPLKQPQCVLKRQDSSLEAGIEFYRGFCEGVEITLIWLQWGEKCFQDRLVTWHGESW